MSDGKDLVRSDVIEPLDVIPAITVSGGGFLRKIHKPSACAGQPCCIHNPSAHPLRDAQLHWRADRRIMERICEHGIGHPDPDDRKTRSNWAEGVHGCDGCCSGQRSELRHDDGAT
jgi:hypothetical protein